MSKDKGAPQGFIAGRLPLLPVSGTRFRWSRAITDDLGDRTPAAMCDRDCVVSGASAYAVMWRYVDDPADVPEHVCMPKMFARYATETNGDTG